MIDIKKLQEVIRTNMNVYYYNDMKEALDKLDEYINRDNETVSVNEVNTKKGTDIILDDGMDTIINVKYSIGCIENCFSDNGYVMVVDDNTNKTYMITPKIVKYMIADY